MPISKNGSVASLSVRLWWCACDESEAIGAVQDQCVLNITDSVNRFEVFRPQRFDLIVHCRVKVEGNDAVPPQNIKHPGRRQVQITFCFLSSDEWASENVR